MLGHNGLLILPTKTRDVILMSVMRVGRMIIYALVSLARQLSRKFTRALSTPISHGDSSSTLLTGVTWMYGGAPDSVD